MSLTITDAKVIALVIPIIAVLLTAGRLLLRTSSRRFSIDDGCTTLSMGMLLVFSIGTFVSLGHVDKTASAALFYVLSQLFYAVLWSARLSILFSALSPTASPRTKYTILAAATLFVVCWGFLFAQVFWVCEKASAWKSLAEPKCVLGPSVALAQLITDVVADAILLAVPVVLLFDANTTRNHRVQLLLITAAGTVTTVVSLVHAYYIRSVGGLEELVVAIVEISLTLMVCNTAVIGTAIINLFKKPEPLDRWEMCRTPSFNGLSSVFSSDTVKTIHLSPYSGTKVSYEGNTPYRKSPSLWGPDGAGVHITQEQVSVLHFPTPAVVKGSV